MQKYRDPKPAPLPPTNTGYPNAIPNTQTMRTRGTKNTTRGNSNSKKMG